MMGVRGILFDVGFWWIHEVAIMLHGSDYIMRSRYFGVVALLAMLTTPVCTAAQICTVGTEAVIASWYGPGHDGRPTANGERFNRRALTAAHPCLPFGSRVAVEDMVSHRTVIVRINDRGPFHPGRHIDLSEAAARSLGLSQRGVGLVRLTVVGVSSVCPPQRPSCRPSEVDVSRSMTDGDSGQASVPSIAGRPG